MVATLAAAGGPARRHHRLGIPVLAPAAGKQKGLHLEVSQAISAGTLASVYLYLKYKYSMT